MTSKENTLTKTASRAELLDGAPVAAEIRREVIAGIEQLGKEHKVTPYLAAVRVGDDPASEIYVRNKIRACEEVGIRSEQHVLPASATATEILDLVGSLNAREEIDGILVQMPLPRGIEEGMIIDALDPKKDVDGFHPLNVGRLAVGRPTFVPCTPAGIIELLKRNQIQMRGVSTCVVGRSNIVGRPMSQLLIQNDATVTICHSRTPDLASVTRRAEILVVAIGRPGFIGKEHIKSGATVIDVGMNKITDLAAARTLFGDEAEQRIKTIAQRGYTLVGDVHPAEAAEVAGRRTPVPGGVGLLTVAMLMRNTLQAATMRRGVTSDK